ncbi:MAG: hypothetical protein MHM6MM_006163 [Cercozoa sp. M6MM]
MRAVSSRVVRHGARSMSSRRKKPAQATTTDIFAALGVDDKSSSKQAQGTPKKQTANSFEQLLNLSSKTVPKKPANAPAKAFDARSMDNLNLEKQTSSEDLPPEERLKLLRQEHTEKTLELRELVAEFKKTRDMSVACRAKELKISLAKLKAKVKQIGQVIDATIEKKEEPQEEFLSANDLFVALAQANQTFQRRTRADVKRNLEEALSAPTQHVSTAERQNLAQEAALKKSVEETTARPTTVKSDDARRRIINRQAMRVAEDGAIEFLPGLRAVSADELSVVLSATPQELNRMAKEELGVSIGKELVSLEAAELLCECFEREVRHVVASEGVARKSEILTAHVPSDELLGEVLAGNTMQVLEQLRPRPPRVCVMGHIDHGKTTLLDHLRRSKLAASEAGGITQTIGAFPVKVATEVTQAPFVTFFDTPGHAAFGAMRERGATLADVAIIVVAADEGVRSQTRECVRVCKQLGLPYVIALTKIDKKNADIEMVTDQLRSQGILLGINSDEDSTESVAVQPISAVSGKGIEDLLAEVELTAAAQSLQRLSEEHREQVEALGHDTALLALQKGNAVCSVIESQSHPVRGVVTTVLVEHGTLSSGTHVVCGDQWARVKSLSDWRGKRIRRAEASLPVALLGFKHHPPLDKRLLVTDSAHVARRLAEREARRLRDLSSKSTEPADEDWEAKRAAFEAALEAGSGKETREQDAIITASDGRLLVGADEFELADLRALEKAKRAASKKEHIEALKERRKRRRGRHNREDESDEEDEDEITEETVRNHLVRSIKVIAKAPSHGQLTALRKFLEEVRPKNRSARVEVLSGGVGDLCMSDLRIAALDELDLVANFGVSVDSHAREMIDSANELRARRNQGAIDILTSDVIFKLAEQVGEAVKSVSRPDYKETPLGRAKVLKTFNLRGDSRRRKFNAAGLYVESGSVKRDACFRLWRDGKVVFESYWPAYSMKHFRDDVTELETGTEGAIAFFHFDGVEEGDEVRCFVSVSLSVCCCHVSCCVSNDFHFHFNSARSSATSARKFRRWCSCRRLTCRRAS